MSTVALIVDNVKDVPGCVERAGVLVLTPDRLNKGVWRGLLIDTFVLLTQDDNFIDDAYSKLHRPHVTVSTLSLSPSCKLSTYDNHLLIDEGKIRIKLK